MTKQELYAALQSQGVKLPEYRRITQAALEKLYAEHSGASPATEPPPAKVAQAQQPEQSQGTPPALYFDHAGWCDALGRSYFMGYYWPQSWAEYEALRPFAKGGAK